jgi:CubicO group peptidase (beta-lactamase class C family)
MKKIFLVFSVTVFLLLWGDSFSQDRHLRIFTEDESYNYKFSYRDSAGLDSFITSYMTGHHIPGASASIVKRGSIIWTGNYGWAYTDLNIPIYDSTLFQIASVSKTVTTAVLMRLYEKGLFGLDDSINAYLPFSVRNPYYPDSPITFRMLLTHTSSIRDNWNFMFYYFHRDPPLALGDYLDDYFTPDSHY